MPAVETRDLEKQYGDVAALRGVDITVEEGAFHGLLGPNGAGKTTFISILCGLVRKSGGSATVFGHDVEEDYRWVRDRIGLAPQEPDIDRFFTIREVLMNKAGYHGMARRAAGARADELLERFGIAEKADVKVHKLSGGMKRRLLLARALVTDPDLIILDEPTAGVDVELRHELWEQMRALQDAGRTILLTTHYIEEAEELCETVTILDDGRVVTTDAPDDLVATGIDTVRVSVDARPDAALDLPEADEVAWEDDTVVVRAQRATRLVPRVVEQLEAAGADILDVETHRRSLEEVFMELTGDAR